MARARSARRPVVDDRPHVRYHDDYIARVFRLMHPDGATLEVVGAMFDLTRERIRQVEARALKRLRKSCNDHGLDIRDVLGCDPEESAV